MGWESQGFKESRGAGFNEIRFGFYTLTLLIYQG
jgi:hypothetical protein